MIVRERIHVDATPAQIWAILRDPELMSRWNPHGVRCEAKNGGLRVGVRFTTMMCFHRGSARQLSCEVLECEAERLLTLRFSGEAVPRTDGYVGEAYVLRPTSEGTEVLHEVDFSDAGLPWLVRAVLKVIHLVGQERSRSPLKGLKRMAEESQG